MKKILLICLCLLSYLSLFAQRTINGKVTDSSGETLIGATVIQKGTSNGVITNIDGIFTISLLPNVPEIIQVSMIGYKKAELNLQKQGTSLLNVVLTEDNVNLDEVVVVGYGTQKKASITGAISNVGNKELTSVPVSSVTNALTGRIPGLVTRQESGRPGGDEAKMFIRGNASFNETEPLVLVDGVERSFTQINQDDIESISILKDASATAVYGVRGANGVILVTTRRGQERSKAQINFSAELGITEFNRIPEVLDAATVGRFQREGTMNDDLDPSKVANTKRIGVSEYDIYLYKTQLSPFTHPDNHYVDMFTKNGFTQKYNVNISGGTKKLKYFVSFSHFQQDGMFQTDVNEIKKHPTIQKLIELSPAVGEALTQPDYDAEYYFTRTTARSNIDISLNDDFTLSVDLSYIFRKQNRPAAYDGLTSNSENMRLFGMFYRCSPQSYPIVNPDGSMAANDGLWRQNPLVTLAYTGYRTDYNSSMESSIRFKYNLRKLLKGLSIDGRFSFDSDWGNWRGMQWRPYIYKYNPESDSYTQGLAGISPPNVGSDKIAATYKTYGEIALRYKTTLAELHNLSGMISGSIQSISRPSGGTEYVYVPHIYQNLVGRINYDFGGRYLIEVNGGYNGSNRFSKGNRYAFFPSGSIGWIPTSETFFPENKILNFMKLRASIGKVGNDNLGSSFNYYYVGAYGTEKMGGVNSGYAFGEGTGTAITAGLSEIQMPNVVTWETATKYNIGVESALFDSSFSMNIDFFKERREDILTNPKRYVLAAGAVGLPPYNFGIVENKGFEMELGWNSTIGKVNYYLKGIYAFNRNKVIEKSEAAKPYPYMYEAGLPIKQFIGYQYDGFFSSYDEIASSPQQFGLTNLKPGDIKYKDINGDGIVDENDQAPIGYSTVPEMTYSLQLGASYKGFDVSVMFQGAARSSVYLYQDLGWDNMTGNYYEEHINRWTPETAATATYPRFLQGSKESHQNYYLSDFWLKDGKYLRLKNVMISYTFDKKMLRKTPFSSLKIFASGFNLITWDKLKKVDPEVAPSSNTGYFYPQQRQYNMGINVSF